MLGTGGSCHGLNIEAGAGQRIGQAKMRRKLVDHDRQKVEERLAGLLGGGQGICLADDIFRSVVNDRYEQRFFGREVATDGAGSNTGASSDFVNRHR